MVQRVLLALLLSSIALPPADLAAEPSEGAQPAASGGSSGEHEAEEGQVEAPAAPAPPRALAELPIQASATGLDGETIVLGSGDDTTIAPEASFRLWSERALVDLRIRLRDERGKLVPTRDQLTVGEGTVYVIRPQSPLAPGSKFELFIDGQDGPSPQDLEGTAYATLSITFRTSGEKPPPPPKVRKRR